MTITATITAIGEQALAAEDPLVILFDEQATPALREIAVIQQFESVAAQGEVAVQVGDQLTIDSASYTIQHVGQLANTNLQTIGHVSLIFAAVPEQPQANALYLTPQVKPEVKVGGQISYPAAADGR